MKQSTTVSETTETTQHVCRDLCKYIQLFDKVNFNTDFITEEEPMDKVLEEYGISHEDYTSLDELGDFCNFGLDVRTVKPDDGKWGEGYKAWLIWDCPTTHINFYAEGKITITTYGNHELYTEHVTDLEQFQNLAHYLSEMEII